MALGVISSISALDLLNSAKDVKLAMISVTATAMTRILARLDLRVLLASLAPMANQVPMERRERQDHQEPSPHGSKYQHPDLASNAHQVPKDRLEVPANQARLARKAFPAARATMANQAQLARQEMLDHQVHQDPEANPARRDHLVTMPKKARKERQANLERKDHPDLQDPLETKDQEAKLAHQALQALPAHLVLAANQETKVPLESPARLANLVQTPTIVLARNARPRLRRRLPRKPRHKRRLVNDRPCRKSKRGPLVLDNVLPLLSMQFSYLSHF